MCSEMSRFVAAVACVVATATGVGAGAAAQAARVFFPDDPISRDDDTAIDASSVKEHELSESYDFLINTFVPPGDREPIRAVNVNTLDEVPDSSWFTNRIGTRPITADELQRGPVTGPAPAPQKWTLTREKSAGMAPGFTAQDANGETWFVSFDARDNPRGATAAVVISNTVIGAPAFMVSHRLSASTRRSSSTKRPPPSAPSRMRSWKRTRWGEV